MANGVFNVSFGRVNDRVDRVETGAGNEGLVVSLWQDATEADAALRDRATLAAVAGANTECTATNYARIVLDDTDLASGSTVDNTGNTRFSDISDPTWVSLGGAANNDLDKMIIGYDPDTTTGTDTTIEPLTFHDFLQGASPFPTNGSDVTAQLSSAYFFLASE